MLVAIDPGLVCTGVAVFRDGSLYEAHAVRGLGPEYLLENRLDDMITRVLYRVDESEEADLVCEWPQIYKGSREDPNGLLPLAAIVGGVLAFAWASTALYKPREWKGSVPKKIHQPRILDALKDHERGILEEIPKTYRHNAVDAVGLGLWASGRMEK